MFKKRDLSCDYLKIFILEHYSRDMVRVVIENDGSVVEGRSHDPLYKNIQNVNFDYRQILTSTILYVTNLEF